MKVEEVIITIRFVKYPSRFSSQGIAIRQSYGACNHHSGIRSLHLTPQRACCLVDHWDAERKQLTARKLFVP